MKWMNSTFLPRQLPEAIMVRDEGAVLGPFCVHCGAPVTEHGPRRRCPSVVSPLYPPPACKCHGVREPVTR